MWRSNDGMGIYDIKFSVKIINIYSHAGGQKKSLFRLQSSAATKWRRSKKCKAEWSKNSLPKKQSRPEENLRRNLKESILRPQSSFPEKSRLRRNSTESSRSRKRRSKKGKARRPKGKSRRRVSSVASRRSWKRKMTKPAKCVFGTSKWQRRSCSR